MWSIWVSKNSSSSTQLVFWWFKDSGTKVSEANSFSSFLLNSFLLASFWSYHLDFLRIICRHLHSEQGDFLAFPALAFLPWPSCEKGKEEAMTYLTTSYLSCPSKLHQQRPTCFILVLWCKSCYSCKRSHSPNTLLDYQYLRTWRWLQSQIPYLPIHMFWLPVFNLVKILLVRKGHTNTWHIYVHFTVKFKVAHIC